MTTNSRPDSGGLGSSVFDHKFGRVGDQQKLWNRNENSELPPRYRCYTGIYIYIIYIYIYIYSTVRRALAAQQHVRSDSLLTI